MSTWIQDIRYSARTLLYSSGFRLAAAVALAVGIGCTIPSLHYSGPSHSASVAQVWEQSVASAREVVSRANYPDWKSRNHVFGDTTAVVDLFSMNLTGAGNPEVLTAGAVTSNFFQRIGVQPIIGRAFAAGEDTRGRDHVAILSYKLWRRRFAGDAEILSKSITLNGERHLVIGILPQDFAWNDRAADVWIPYAIRANGNYRLAGGRFMPAAARRVVKVDQVAL